MDIETPTTAVLTVLPVYAPFFEDWRYKVAIGGRSAGRSVAAAQALIYFGSRAPMRIIVLREYLNSIDESAKAQIQQLIEQLGVRHEWTFTLKNLVHKRTGTVIMFAGMARNYTKIKSLTDIDIALVEECETVSRESIDVLIPGIRKPGSEIWFCGNPASRLSAVAQLYVENGTPSNCVIMRSTYLDNPYNSEELVDEANQLMTSDYKRYRHVYLGEYLDMDTALMVPYSVIDDGSVICNASDVVVTGVDIARSGGDATVICTRKGKKILELTEHYDMEIGKLTALLTGVIHRFRPQRLNLDATGFGAYAADALKVSGIRVEAINFASKSPKEDRHTNMRTYLYSLAKEYFEAGGTIPDDPKLQEELQASYYHYDSKNRFALESKDDIRKRIGRSNDRSDAFVLSLYNPAGMFARDMGATSALNTRLLTQNLLNAGSYGGSWK